MQTNKTYVLSPYALLLRDKPNLFAKRLRGTTNEEAIKLEQYVNDLYHHFLYKLTSEMQSADAPNETKLRALFEELIKSKKILEEIQ
jgi:hypothetical protein